MKAAWKLQSLQNQKNLLIIFLYFFLHIKETPVVFRFANYTIFCKEFFTLRNTKESESERERKRVREREIERERKRERENKV